MVAINYAFREISCKIVYYGPGLSGKTTNLQYIHQKVPGKTKGELISLATDADRTLYFDFLPINLGAIQGFATKFQLYTVPGQVYYNATRKLVLRGVDGLVFVADSQREKMDDNLESLNNLFENLKEYGYDRDDLPIVIQYNKRDVPDVLSVPELEAALNPHGFPSFEAVAVNGGGVFDTLKHVIKLVLDKARKGSSIDSAAAPSASVEAKSTASPTTASVGASGSTPATPEGDTAKIGVPAGAAREYASVALPQTQEPNSVAAVATVAPPILKTEAPTQTYAGLGVADDTGKLFAGAELAPTVIPAAPSLRRKDGTQKKKRSFWRKLFSWI
jgi:signal recognition particle receptor subunit beta